MWWDVVIDVFWPAGESRTVERVAERSAAGTIAVEPRVPGAFRRSLNESGWLADEVIAAGVLRQGRAPSPLGLVSGFALIEMLRPRRAKAFPREFALALTADRVLAFAMSPWKDGDGTTDRVVRIKPGELRSWPRGSLTVSGLTRRLGAGGGTLELADGEWFPVTWDGDPSTDELLEQLMR